MDSGLREIEVTCGGTIDPRPSPSWLKYELTSRPRLAARLTRVYLESTLSSSASIGGSLLVGLRSAIQPSSYRVSQISGQWEALRAARHRGTWRQESIIPASSAAARSR